MAYVDAAAYDRELTRLYQHECELQLQMLQLGSLAALAGGL